MFRLQQAAKGELLSRGWCQLFRTCIPTHQVLKQVRHPICSSQLNNIMSAYSRDRDYLGVLDFFICARRNPTSQLSSCIDFITLAILLTACHRSPPLLNTGPQVHAFVIASGLDSDVTVCNCLMTMYAGSELFEEFQRVFKSMRWRDVVSWNTAISVYARNEFSEDALHLCLDMRCLGFDFDKVTFTGILTACSDLQMVSFGWQIHAVVVEFGLELDVFVCNSLITLYAKSNNVDDSRKVFNGMVDRDIVSWNAIISGYAQQGDRTCEAVHIFLEMLRCVKDIRLDEISYASILSACIQEQNLKLGWQCHTLIMKQGCHNFVNVCNSLMSMYAKCGAMEEANRVFSCMAHRNVVSWTCMITLNEAVGFDLFREMIKADIQPNQVTFVALINAGTSMRETGMVHGLALSMGFSLDVNVANTLISLYAKWGDMKGSERIFEEMQRKDVVSWNALITGFAQNELYLEALAWFALMEEQPNQFTFGGVLSACSGLLSLIYGHQFHCQIIKLGFYSNMYVGSALIDMYAKCGEINYAQQVFDETPQRSVISWTVIISGQAQHGNCYKVLQLFEQMENEGVKPDPVAFLALFSACGRAGLVEEGRRYFKSMNKYGIEATREHLSSMVDMLGRAGRVAEAEEFINEMDLQTNITAWQSLLGACRKHGNMEVGSRAATALMELDPGDSATYVLLSNICAADRKWEEVAGVRRIMRAKGVRKEVGCSWVDINGRIHNFTTEDMSHPSAEEIVETVECLSLEMRSLGNEIPGNILL